MKLDPFYLVVDDVSWIKRFLPLGLRLVQLRIKERPEADIGRQVRLAKSLCAAAGATLVINDYWKIALEEGCDWLHLGQEDLAEADLKAIKRQGLRLGLSTHDEAELDTALAAEPDYVALGPIYPTVLKAMKWAPQGPERLTEWRRHLGHLPLVAIGGLTVERASGVFAQGADCAAVVTDVLRAENPEQRLQDWLSVTANRREV